ncbi:MAG: efflux RND transporter periplasmic adaptor subunit [Pirellula sp.]
MTTSAAPQSTRDPLQTLRIDRTSANVPRRSPNRGKWWFVSFLFLGTSIGLWQWLARSKDPNWLTNWIEIPDAIKSRKEVRCVRPAIEKGRSAEATVVATGYIESRRQAKIGARAPGRVQSLFVEEGSRVKKDEVLAVLEHSDLDAALAATRASVARSNAALEEQKLLIAQNAREFARMESLVATQSASKSDYDAAKYQYDSSRARLESMKADVALADARLKEAEQLRENMFIRAPFDGTVISKDAEVGESILPGGMGEASGRGSAVTIADLENLEIDCDVKEDYINRVRSDQQAEIAIDAVPGVRYRGVVRKIIPMGDRARATIKVKVTISDVDDKLFPDMSGTVYFLPAAVASEPTDDRPRMFLPTDTIVSDAESAAVWTVDEKNHAQKVTITIGKQRDNKTEILSGLTGTEKVIQKPTDFSPGQALKVIE